MCTAKDFISEATVTAMSVCVSFMLVPAVDATAQTAADEAPYLAEADCAMMKMMDDMAVKPSRNIDRDFAAMMIPHHQGAIEMAQAELIYGHNEQLRRIAQEIVVEQQQEIIAMHLALGEPLPPPATAHEQQEPVHARVTPTQPMASHPICLGTAQEKK